MGNPAFPGFRECGVCLAARYPRWNYGLLDTEILAEALEWSCVDDTHPGFDSERPAESMAQWIDRMLRDACDMAAPRVGKANRPTNAYWWCSRIADLRLKCIRAKRQLTRFNSHCIKRNRGLVDGSFVGR